MPNLKSGVPAAEGLAAVVAALAGGLAAGLSLGSAGADMPHVLSPLEVRQPALASRSSRPWHTARGAAHASRARGEPAFVWFAIGRPRRRRGVGLAEGQSQGHTTAQDAPAVLAATRPYRALGMIASAHPLPLPG
jgi:hypothetical protein